MHEVFVGIGSNVEREHHIGRALEMMRTAFGSLRLSYVYETAPVGFIGDPFFNLVVGFATGEPPAEVASRLSAIERDLGRQRTSGKFSARAIDLDLLLYGDLVVDTGSLRLPREDITRYAFVLEPLNDIAAEHRHPVLGESFAALWAAFDKTGLVQRRLPLPTGFS